MACSRTTVLQALETIAPVHLAESWDNVGLLVDPGEASEFCRAFVTIDLTDATLSEALELQADLIVAYHPPIFSGLKRLRADEVSERMIVKALRAGLTIYSPHTALDAVSGGMCDWLSTALGPAKSAPILPHESDAAVGSGRLARLEAPATIEQAIVMVKAHLGLSSLRVSRASHDRPIVSLGVCPGAGGQVFEKLDSVDLLLTGEMRHHDVLAFRAKGTHVILTDHTNTERGYLPTFAANIRKACAGLEVSVSKADADPLVVV